jgi:hypothetical protein
MAGENPVSVTVTAGATAQVTVSVTCAALVGDVEVTASTTGDDLDADGYTVEIDGADPRSLPINGNVTFAQVAQGSHSVELSGIAENCSVAGGNPRSVAVSAGSTATVTFQVECVPLTGSIEVTTATAGDDLDPDGYDITLDGTSAKTIEPSGTVTFEDVPVGSRSLALTDVAPNCTISGDNPRSIEVILGETARTTFAVVCSSQVGDLSVPLKRYRSLS